MDISIIHSLSSAALLEQCAEECSELAHACLKQARKIRGENPTPASEQEIIEKLNEEAADVFLCLSLLFEADLVTFKQVASTWYNKRTRWEQRLEQSQKY